MSKKPKIDETLAKGVELDWTEEKEQWNTYSLTDGTTLKVKIVLQGVKRFEKYNLDGIPVYAIRSSNIVRALDVPKELRRKPEPSSTPTV